MYYDVMSRALHHTCTYILWSLKKGEADLHLYQLQWSVQKYVHIATGFKIFSLYVVIDMCS